MWHASIAHHGRRPGALTEHTARALRALHSVGDSTLGEWRHVGQTAVHVRRRLSAAEVASTGLIVRDVRGTPEADVLLSPFRHLLPAGYME